MRKSMAIGPLCLREHLHLLREPGPKDSPPLGAQHQFQGQRALDPMDPMAATDRGVIHGSWSSVNP